MLIERECELERLVALLGGPVTGTAVLVHGDSGSGKSGFLRAAVERARRDGDTVVVASGDALEAGYPFGVVKQLFERLAVDAAAGPGGADRADGLLGGPAAAAARVLAPWLPAGAPGADGADPGPHPDADPTTLNGLYWLAVHLASAGRLVIVVDDLQWADAPSLRWLRYLLRRAGSLPVVVIATLGPGRAAADNEELGAVLPLFRHQLTLSGLGPEDTAAVVRELFGSPADPAFTAECHRATGGNPFLLYALLRSLRSAGLAPDARTAADLLRHVPPDVGRAVYTLLANTGPDAAAVAQAVAVLGGSPAVELLAGATGLTEGRTADAGDALVRAGLMVRCGDGLRFVCATLATAVADGVVPSARQDLHLRAARLLAARQAPLDRIAGHLLRAPVGEPDTAEVLRRAAVAAVRDGRPDLAAAYSRRALREPLGEDDRATLLITRGEAELATSVPAAVDHLRRGLALSRRPEERTSAARTLAGALFALDRYPDGLEVLSSTSEAVRAQDAAGALHLEAEHAFAALSRAGSAAAALPRLLDMDLADAAGGAAERPMAALLSLRAAMAGEDPARVVALARQALDEGPHPVEDRSGVYLAAVLALGAVGQAGLALAHAEAAVAASLARGSALARARARVARAGVHSRLGRVPQARADAEAALRALAEIGVGPRNSYCVAPQAVLIDSLVKQGLPAQAAAQLGDAGLDGDLDGHWGNDYVLLVRGRLLVASGRPQDALADFLACGRRMTARSMPGPGFLAWRAEAALTQAALGRHEAARTLAAEELDLARDLGVPECVGGALRVAGAVTGGPEGLAMLRQAVELLAGTTAALGHAQALADLGTHARRAGRFDEAREHLQQAADLAHGLGATAVADRALAELRAIGDRPRTRTFSGVAALTPTERRVSALAAQGLTNREIAQQLFVGLRTVEVHLTNTYGKLGIGGRPELAAALGAEGGAGDEDGGGAGAG
ncbi:AAA family ATPase [Kitasatospora sp. NPDC094015]|uniref:AAA family ATPase n=1 Tax=Kitasatospora sp. NPDC094015 TaxID=3155205 RepID=UPI00332B96B0